jgi:tetratricopeptide (TPR) repeat protein
LAADASDATSVLPARPTRANAAAAAAAPAAPAGAPRLTRTLVPADQIDRLLDAAWSAAAARRTADARRLYSEVLQLDRNNVDAYVGLAHVAVQAGDGMTAERAWRRVLDIDPNDPVARAGLVALLGSTDAGAQESQLRHLAATAPADPALQFTLGNVMAAQGRWAEAQQAFFAAVAGEPDQPDYLFNLAVSLERLRQPVAALPLYRKALEAAAVRPARFEAAAAARWAVLKASSSACEVSLIWLNRMVMSPCSAESLMSSACSRCFCSSTCVTASTVASSAWTALFWAAAKAVSSSAWRLSACLRACACSASRPTS